MRVVCCKEFVCEVGAYTVSTRSNDKELLELSLNGSDQYRA